MQPCCRTTALASSDLRPVPARPADDFRVLGCGFVQPGRLPWGVSGHQPIGLGRSPRPDRVRVRGRRVGHQRLQDPPALSTASWRTNSRSLPVTRRTATVRRAPAVRPGRARTPSPAALGAARLWSRPDNCSREAGLGSDAQHDLVRLPLGGVGQEPQPGRVPQYQPHLGVADRQLFAGPDEVRHPGPPPAVDLQPQRDERLRARRPELPRGPAGSRRTGRVRSAAGPPAAPP